MMAPWLGAETRRRESGKPNERGNMLDNDLKASEEPLDYHYSNLLDQMAKMIGWERLAREVERKACIDMRFTREEFRASCKAVAERSKP